jgi:hypothetical protein
MKLKLFSSFVLYLITISIPNISFGEDDWNIFTVQNDDGQVFQIPYRISGGNIEAIEYEFASLLLILDTDESGFVEISIPRNLLDENIEDNYFFVILDGNEIKYEETKTNPCYRTAIVKFLDGSKHLEFLATVAGHSVPTTYVPPIQLFSNATYHAGETVTVEGCTSLALDEGNIRIDVLDQQGKIVKTMSVTPEIDGIFSSIFVIDNQSQTDTYTVTATYGGYTAVPEFPTVFLILMTAIIGSLLIHQRIGKVRNI